MTVTVRNARRRDIDQIATFNTLLAAETESKHLDFETVQAGVAAVFDNRTNGRYWIAETDGQAVGQMLVTTEWSDWRNKRFWWIASVFVTDTQRAHGVFRTLYRHIENLAQTDPEVCGLRLYVEIENERARAVYEKMGMIDAGYRVMEAEFKSNGA